MEYSLQPDTIATSELIGSITSLLMGLIDFGTKNLKKREKSSEQFS